MPRTKRTTPSSASQFIDDEAAEVGGSDESVCEEEFSCGFPSRSRPPGAPVKKKKFRPSLRMLNTMKKARDNREPSPTCASPDLVIETSPEVSSSPKSRKDSPPPFRKLNMEAAMSEGPATPPVQVHRKSTVFSLGARADVLVYFE